jgi:outer membrane receptor protein involved in Fe transport
MKPNIRFPYSRLIAGVAGAACFFSIAPAIASDGLPAIVISAPFQQTPEKKLGASTTVIDARTIENRHAEQLEDILDLAPNVNYASGASRGRYIQIRGIGERAQFVEPVNYSVGVIVDGIDLTGISGAATLFDTQQVEILRGPQGTLYGANALAGLINVVSNAPADYSAGGVAMTAANYDTLSLNGFTTGPINENSAYRVAFQRNISDGYISNDYLGRDDTNNIDETSFRARFDWQAADDLHLDLVLLGVDIDNGYDAFSLDKTRQTLSDEPGHDRQRTDAMALKSSLQLDSGNQLTALVSYADSDIEYGFDEDWSYPEICAGLACDGFEYSSFDNYLRDNSNLALDLRLAGPPNPSKIEWTAGIYLRRQSQDLRREYTFASEDFLSEYETLNQAIYSEVRFPLNPATRLITGVRLEQRDADYNDSNDEDREDSENMWGGKLAIERELESGDLAYALVSRGYKAGGFNTNASIPENLRDYEQETMINYEVGVKADWPGIRLQTQLSVFYQQRDNIQIDQSLVQPISGSDCPCTFEDYIDNATSGSNYGLEAQLLWFADDTLTVFGSLGLLESQFDDFISFSHVDADPDTGTGVNLEGREQAHAPSWMYTLGFDYYLSNRWVLRLDSEGKDEFYFGDGHDEKSRAYQLYNASLSWRRHDWSFAMWIKNLTDEDYYTRGFGSFGNDPRNFYETDTYYQYGDPRTYGISFGYQF